MRIMHEASLYKANAFVTLTYDDNHYPEHGQLNHKHYQDFMKRLRHHYQTRYFMCGEYGETTKRPHYHAGLFNTWFEDYKVYKQNHEGQNLYTSETLSKLWPMGFATFGHLTYQSAAYMARYIMTKPLGKHAKDRREAHLAAYGYDLVPEYNKCSLKPGIGARWFELYQADIYNHDIAVVNGKPTKPPTYYDKLLKRQDPDKSRDLKEERILRAMDHREDNTAERLKIKEQVLKAKIRQLIRPEI